MLDIQKWEVIKVIDNSREVIGNLTTSKDAKKRSALHKAYFRYANSGFTIGFKLDVKKVKKSC